ncbi:MAG: hypothetical protein IE889_03345 [Campylobacterales bacterium]|nr:hypothetical protein [Campylobacterales bacterium]
MKPVSRHKPQQENGVTTSMILITIFSMALALLLTLPKIYLNNQIYYESRKIAQYQTVAQTLREEHETIKNRLEAIKYQDHESNLE